MSRKRRSNAGENKNVLSNRSSRSKRCISGAPNPKVSGSGRRKSNAREGALPWLFSQTSLTHEALGQGQNISMMANHLVNISDDSASEEAPDACILCQRGSFLPSDLISQFSPLGEKDGNIADHAKESQHRGLAKL